ncbi:hypothetical protein [Hyphomonas sp.]|uniref:hypothetical protein n=1 Tax=Hyphomonas sp. TaxID=87 RepID=UPI0025BAEE6B|nr:hypothetical protein [Hyphomonas sp.]
MTQEMDRLTTPAAPNRRLVQFLFAYTLIIAVSNLVWEIAHAPLYTIWIDGTRSEIAFAIAHCTLGDVLIAAFSVSIAWLITSRGGWPNTHYWRVAGLSVLFGLAYTVFSEWLNISVRESWAYRETMPTIGPLETGVSPLLQWLILPSLTFAWLKSAMRW